MKKIVDVRALVQSGADQGADYHAKPDGHWKTPPRPDPMKIRFPV